MQAKDANVNVNTDGIEGVVGVFAELGILDRIPHYDSETIGECISYAVKSVMSSVLFRSQLEIKVFDKMEIAEKLTRRRIGRVYNAEVVVECPKPKRPPNIDGCVGYAHELVTVDAKRVTDPEDIEMARKWLNCHLCNILIFATYELALKFQKAWIAQKKRHPRLVGMDRPWDVIDADGGRNILAVTSGDKVLLTTFGIAPFGSSTRGRLAKQAKQEAINKHNDFKKKTKEDAMDRESVQQQEHAHESAAQVDMLKRRRSTVCTPTSRDNHSTNVCSDNRSRQMTLDQCLPQTFV